MVIVLIYITYTARYLGPDGFGVISAGLAFANLFVYLSDLGLTTLTVRDAAGNKAARAFFEALGATLVAEQPCEWDGLHLDESGYAFADLDALLAACDTAPRTQAPEGASQALH
jgi:hypothetical protein